MPHTQTSLTEIKYAAADQSEIFALLEGKPMVIPAREDNRFYVQILADQLDIAPFAPSAPTKEDVQREAQRRIMALLGAESEAEKQALIETGLRDAASLHQKQLEGQTLAVEETQRLQVLSGLAQKISGLEQAAALLQAPPPIPEDFAQDHHWVLS